MKRCFVFVLALCLLLTGCLFKASYKPIEKDNFIAACEKYDVVYLENSIRDSDFDRGVDGVTYSLFANKGESSYFRDEDPYSTVLHWRDYYVAYYLEFESEDKAKVFYGLYKGTMTPIRSDASNYKSNSTEGSAFQVCEYETTGTYESIARSGSTVFYIRCISQPEYRGEAEDIATIVFKVN